MAVCDIVPVAAISSYSAGIVAWRQYRRCRGACTAVAVARSPYSRLDHDVEIGDLSERSGS